MNHPASQIRLTPIGVIHTPFQESAGAPIQPSRARRTRGTVQLFDQYREGLKDLDGFERIWLIYQFHRAAEPQLAVVPYLDNRERGIFATRAPARPNPIGISAVRLLRVKGATLEVAEVDVLDGTPLLDIKPYVAEFDCYPVKRSGWVDRSPIHRRAADDRFEEKGR
jgi:tRNA-Thr(GGU) m(6)t(6)A37 methyltransferase TsaA